ncbi:MAG: hypothetical protein IPL46_07165 [Saprospiraceae bacterium]|nr:hypothetical protein [Saprospiraceae bacterium]
MNTKLTLTIEKEVIEEAKEYAKKKGQSLSNLVENYFKLLTKDDRQVRPKKLSPRVKRLRGILKVDKDFDYKSVLEEELTKKYEI